MEVLDKLDPEGVIYCFDPENEQIYGFDGLPSEMAPKIYF